ncbi:MAG: Gfo/Idh/MocA family oxidoreductase [Victivallales bacterium]
MKEVRIGIVGLGNMGAAHVGFVKNIPRAKLVALCDLDKAKADAFAGRNSVKAYCDGVKMIRSGDIDAVIIATPHYAHTPLAIEGFRAGVHVLTEKPIAVHKSDAQKMIDAHRKNRKVLFAAVFQQRTLGIYGKLKQLLDSGEFGEVRRVNWIITNWFRTQRYYDSGGWRATWGGEGGGVLLNQCPHNLDLFQWLFGMPSKIRAFCAVGKYHDIEVEDEVTAYCEFRNGATGVFITSTGEAPGTNRLEITCDRGRVVVEDGKIAFNRTEEPVSEFCRTTDKAFEGPQTWNVEIPYRETGSAPAHQKIIENFVNAILDGSKLLVRGEEGINSVELANAMLYSSMKDKTITLPLDAGAYADLLGRLVKGSKFRKKEVKSVSAEMNASYGKQ